MAKVIRCRDIGMDCAWEGRAETVEELLPIASQHAKEVHGMQEITPEVAAAVQAAIRDD
jgi:predicted small metal-binding protein